MIEAKTVMRFRSMRTFGAVLVFCSILIGPSRAEGDGRIFYHETLRNLSEELNDDANEAYDKLLSFQAFGRLFEIGLRDNTGLLQFRAQRDIEYLKGRVLHDRASWVRLTRNGGELSGMIRDSNDIYVIEPRRRILEQLIDPAASNGATNIIYRLADSEVPFEELNCATQYTAQASTAAASYDAVISELSTTPTLAARIATDRVTIGILADNELRRLLAPNTEAEIMDRLNIVDGIFSEALGIEIAVADLVVFESNTDPLGTSRIPATLLDSVRNYRIANQLDLGLTHLITGRNLASMTAGLAYVGQPGVSGVCTDTGAALTERGSSTFFSALLIAHEIGHNMGAGHDGEPNTGCETVPETYLMAPVINGNDEFSQCSIDIIKALTSSANCINEIPDVDLVLNPPDAGTEIEAPLGGEFELVFDIFNAGSDAAGNIVAELDIPAGLTLITLSVRDGACSTAKGQCVIDRLGAGAVAGISATLSADTLGSYVVGLGVSAPDDRDITTNSQETNIRVVGLPDLRASIGGISSLESGQMAQASILIENNSSVAATDVTINISATTGLTIDDDVQISAGSCDGTLCTAATLPGLASLQLDLDVTADREGVMAITVDVGATNEDVAPNDNTATLSFSVVTPVTAPTSTGNTANSGGGGGGGALHWFVALLFFALAAWKRCVACGRTRETRQATRDSFHRMAPLPAVRFIP